MSSADLEPETLVAHIGKTAGKVWHVLTENGRMTLPKLAKAVGGSRDTVMQAVGWLAREDKVVIEDQGRNRFISLR